MTRILSRRRRISVKIVSDRNVGKYQSAGRQRRTLRAFLPAGSSPFGALQHCLSPAGRGTKKTGECFSISNKKAWDALLHFPCFLIEFHQKEYLIPAFHCQGVDTSPLAVLSTSK